MCARALLLLLLLAIAGCSENLTHPTDRAAYQVTDPAPLACVPNLDGRIDSGEIGAAIGYQVSYLVGADRKVDTRGTVGADGVRTWDLSVDYADDTLDRVTPVEVRAQWFAPEFPDGRFVTPAEGGLLGIYRQDADAVWLLGFASPDEGDTLLIYEAPVAVLRFPVQDGQSWVAVGRIAHGTLRGLPYAGRDVYQVRVDGAGRVELPDLTFTQAHRVRTYLVVEPSVGAATSVRQVSFFFECFGEVARIRSRLGEAEEDFDTAAELRRIGIPEG